MAPLTDGETDGEGGSAEPGRPALDRAESPAADRRGLLGAVPGTRRWPAPGGALRRPGRGPRRDLGRARHLGERPVADRAGHHLGLRARRGDRQAARSRGTAQGGGRAARPYGEPTPDPVRRQALRVLFRGPAAHRPDRRRLRAARHLAPRVGLRRPGRVGLDGRPVHRTRRPGRPPTWPCRAPRAGSVRGATRSQKRSGRAGSTRRSSTTRCSVSCAWPPGWAACPKPRRPMSTLRPTSIVRPDRPRSISRTSCDPRPRPASSWPGTRARFCRCPAPGWAASPSSARTPRSRALWAAAAPPSSRPTRSPRSTACAPPGSTWRSRPGRLGT